MTGWPRCVPGTLRGVPVRRTRGHGRSRTWRWPLELRRSDNRKRVARPVAAAGHQGFTRRQRWRRAKADTVAFADDLVACSSRPERPDDFCVAGITQHPMRDGCVCFLLVIEESSRHVVGYGIVDHRRTELVIAVCDVANRRRRPAP